MKVYRYANEKELQAILKDDKENIGRIFVNSGTNTHKYNPSKKYLHFFKKFSSIKEIQCLYRDNECKYFICEYDIPLIVLMLGRGKGFYTPSGYDVDVNKCLEYIVPIDKFKSCWLKKYFPDENNLLQATNF